MLSILLFLNAGCSANSGINTSTHNLDYIVLTCEITCDKNIKLTFRNNSDRPIAIPTPCLVNTFIDLYNNGVKLQRRSKVRMNPKCAARSILIFGQSDTTVIFPYSLKYFYNMDANSVYTGKIVYGVEGKECVYRETICMQLVSVFAE